MSIQAKKGVSRIMSYEEIVKKFWDYFDQGSYDQAVQLMSPDVIVRWCNTREIFRGRTAFLEVNSKYPGQDWSIKVEKILAKDDLVITVVKVDCKELELSFYATSFFKLAEGLIQEVDEYWSENSEPPEWRVKEGLAERY